MARPRLHIRLQSANKPILLENGAKCTYFIHKTNSISRVHQINFSWYAFRRERILMKFSLSYFVFMQHFFFSPSRFVFFPLCLCCFSTSYAAILTSTVFALTNSTGNPHKTFANRKKRQSNTCENTFSKMNGENEMKRIFCVLFFLSTWQL